MDFMMKKVVYVGLLLIVIAVIIAIAGSFIGSNSLQGLQQSITQQNITVAAGTYQSVQLNNPNASSLVIIAEHSSSPVSVYLFNSSGFSLWKTALSANSEISGLQDAISLAGEGAIYIFNDSTLAIMPYNTSSSSTQSNTGAISSRPLYYPAHVLLPIGTYYIVVDNGQSGVSVNSRVAYSAPVPEQNVTTQLISPVAKELAFAAAFGTVVFVLFIIGMVITIWGLFKRPSDYGTVGKISEPPDRADEKAMNKYVDQLYKGVGKSKRGRRSVARRRRSAKTPKRMPRR